MRHLGSFLARDERGAIGVMSALLLTVIIGCAALAVDLGSLFLQRRHLQGMADLAAVTAATNLAQAQARAASVLTANRVEADLEVQTGRFAADPSQAPRDRYVAGGAGATATSRSRTWA
jgi:uncharacterized membrane protein